MEDGRRKQPIKGKGAGREVELLVNRLTRNKPTTPCRKTGTSTAVTKQDSSSTRIHQVDKPATKKKFKADQDARTCFRGRSIAPPMLEWLYQLSPCFSKAISLSQG
jgi:hypothetical protein